MADSPFVAEIKSEYFYHAADIQLHDWGSSLLGAMGDANIHMGLYDRYLNGVQRIFVRYICHWHRYGVVNFSDY